MTGPKERPLGVYPNGTVDVRCWCEAEIVNVPIELVRRGQTGSCKYGCGPADISLRARAERRPQAGRRRAGGTEPITASVVLAAEHAFDREQLVAQEALEEGDDQPASATA